MNIGLDLNVLVFDEDDEDDDDIIARITMNYPTKMCTFYSIDNITVSIDNPDHTEISSGGENFICNERYELVKKKIEDLRVMRFN